MSIETVREYFKQFGMENRIMEFDVSSATVEQAAKALGTEEARIAKSLSSASRRRIATHFLRTLNSSLGSSAIFAAKRS